MTRTDIINGLISKHNYQSYLEIGIQFGDNINQITINFENVVSVDPNPEYLATHCCTSDQFFSIYQKKFDIIFIDGLHVSNQVDRDISNSLNFLNTDGTIVIHDCNPRLEENAIVPHMGHVLHWNGSVWMSIVKVRCNNPDISVSVVDTDFGCGIIQKGSQILYTVDPLEKCLNWEYFNTHRKELLNLISIDDFRRIYL
jgi:hypothetical protein